MTRLEAIADPVRLAVVRHLEGHGRATLSDLASAAGVHANTVRSHVAALERAGIVARDLRPPSGRGRRPIEYRLADDWASPPGGFRGLAELLATVVLRDPPDLKTLRHLGRRWGSKRSSHPVANGPLRAVTSVLEHLGFHTSVEAHSVLLSGCPCPLVMPDKPQLVCELTVGAVEGAGKASGIRVTGRAHDPAQRRCYLTLRS